MECLTRHKSQTVNLFIDSPRRYGCASISTMMVSCPLFLYLNEFSQAQSLACGVAIIQNLRGAIGFCRGLNSIKKVSQRNGRKLWKGSSKKTSSTIQCLSNFLRAKLNSQVWRTWVPAILTAVLTNRTLLFSEDSLRLHNVVDTIPDAVEISPSLL